MIAVIVQRGAADRPGSDIADELVTTEAVARERGRNEIDANSSSRSMLTCSGPLLEYLSRGKLVELVQRDRQPTRAVTRGWSMTITRQDDAITVDQTLDLEAVAK